MAMSLALVAEDFRLIVDLAALQGAGVPVSEAARRVADEAVAAGHGARDMAYLRTFLAPPPPG